jgi:hypothetical protein
MAYRTLAKRAQDRALWLESDCQQLRALNGELVNKVGLAKAEISSVRQELRAELTRQSNAQLRIEHLEEKLRHQSERQKARNVESQNSFISMTNEVKSMRHKINRSEIVIRELSGYRARLESVRTRFRMLAERRASEAKIRAETTLSTSTRTTAPAIPAKTGFAGSRMKQSKSSRSRQHRQQESQNQVSQLSEQLSDLYYDLLEGFEKSRTNLSHTTEHVANLRHKFSRDAGALIHEKERLAMHAIAELCDGGGSDFSDEIGRQGQGGRNGKVPSRKSAVSWLNVKEGGLWAGYAFLCKHLHALSEQRRAALDASSGHDGEEARPALLNLPPALVAVDPPSWPHPLPPLSVVHQEILGIFVSAHATGNTNIVCTKARGYAGELAMGSESAEAPDRPVTLPPNESISEQSFTSFTDFVTMHFLKQYKNPRIALAAMHSFLSQISRMCKPGRDFSARAELFAKAMSGKVSIFACWSFAEAARSLKPVQELVRLDSAIGRATAVHLLYGRGFATHTEMIQVENALGDFCEAAAGIVADDSAVPADATKTEKRACSSSAGVGTLLEFVCAQIACGDELRLFRAKSELNARDLVNSGAMRLTRFQDAVHGITKHHAQQMGRKMLTRLFRVAAYEVHAKTLFHPEDEEAEDDVVANVGVNSESAERMDPTPDETADKGAYKTMMMMPVNIEPTLSGLLAFTYWENLQQATPDFFMTAQADARGDLAEERETTRAAQRQADKQKGEEITWAESAQSARPGKSAVMRMLGIED